MSRLEMKDIVFGRTLREPLCRVDFAIGTTYSLDLDTFISLPFSLGFLEDPDEVMRRNPTYIFAALRVCSDNLAVFCNYADIKVPPQSRKVYYALMESSVFPVNAGKKASMVNFHPKVWIIRQTGPEGTLVRVVVMSRNLTRDGSLDCACVLTGKVGKRPATARAKEKHRPLRDFLMYLSRKAPATSKKRARIESIAGDIDKIESFDIAGSQYDDYDFRPLGIPDYSGKNTLDEIAHAPYAAVISPFIDDTVMNRFVQAREKMLLTRDLSVTPAAVNAFGEENIFTMNPQMVDNELDESVDLHAKMYFVTAYQRDEEKWRNYLYLGSTNATAGGFDRNVEFLMRFRFAPYKSSFWDFCAYFKEDPEMRFSPMVGVCDVEDSRREEYQQSLAFRRAVAAIRNATVDTDGDHRYMVTLKVDGGSTDAEIYPLMRPDLRVVLMDGVSFRGLSLPEVSEFYILEAEGVSRVVKVTTYGMPPGRDDAICRSVIDTKEKFFDCVSFLLSDSKTSYVIDRGMVEKALVGGSGQDTNTEYAAVYESLLRQAYESPSTIADIRVFVNSLPADVVPPEFSSLYKMITKALKSLRR